MVAERRFGPVVAVLFAVLGVLLLRLFQVQVLEHTVWAAEADSLVRSSRVLPSHRGRLLDRHGRVLAEDQDVWKVDIVYRDFRRGHPLGIVAQARSTLEMRSVPLREALSQIGPWALEVVQLSPAALDGFAKGKALATASIAIPESTEPVREARANRASDLRFYVGALLRPGEEERRAIRAAEKEEPRSEDPYVEIVARERGVEGKALLAELAADLSKERDRLAQLAGLLPPSRGGTRPSVESLVAELEAARERFENSAADALFEQAAGFTPGRISTQSLVRCFDLEWIARILRWDPPRLRSWEASRRGALERDLAELVAPRILARAGLGEESEVEERILDGLAAFYAPESASSEPAPSWRDLDELCVLDEIKSLFELPRRPRWEGEDGPVLPLCDADVREAAASFDDPWLALGTIAEIAGATLEIPSSKAGEPAGTVRNARDWARQFAAIAERDSRLEGESAREALLTVLRALEARFLAASDAGFEACLAAAATAKEGDALGEPLSFAEERIDRARQKERFLLKDLSSRPVQLVARAEYPLVHQLERHADLYRGFEVLPASKRTIRARDEAGAPVAGMLLGGVRGPSLREMIANEENVRKLREGDLDDDEEIADVAARILRADDATGSHGLEGYFDPELRGRNGWFETSGLDEDRSRGVLRAATNGKDVELTLDLDLQRAAQETLSRPEMPNDPATDRGWFEHPVGAIVLITPDGEVLAAASEPSRRDLSPAAGRDLERSIVRERTLTRPKFTPPGSVIKIFVAAYAIDHLGLDPSSVRFDCEPLGDGGAGYKSMHCHASPHGRSDLARALAVSCNAAFAQLGEEYTPEAMIDMARTFGFGAPTGIRQFEGEAGARRPGLRENATLAHAGDLTKNLAEGAERMRFACGLGRIEATPMQVARATAGLLTGKLPAIRIAREIDGMPVAKEATDLPISKRAREIVCGDLVAVVTDPSGTAYNKGLDRASLGFSFAGKTGSGDKRPMPAELGGTDEVVRGQRKMLKQAWIAGWFPVEDPKAILVVMLHDVTETSSHNSVYVAAQFLRSSAVKRFVEGVAPEDSGTGADTTKRAVEAGATSEGAAEGDHR